MLCILKQKTTQADMDLNKHYYPYILQNVTIARLDEKEFI